MTTTTLTYRCIPDNANGISVTSMPLAASFVGGGWVVIAPKTNDDMYIYGVTFSSTQPATSNDFAYQNMLQIGFGDPSAPPTVKVELPFTRIADTSVGFYLDDSAVFLPEPILCPKNTTVCIRSGDNQGGASGVTYDGVRLLVMVDRRPIQPGESTRFQNFMNAGIGEKSF